MFGINVHGVVGCEQQKTKEVYATVCMCVRLYNELCAHVQGEHGCQCESKWASVIQGMGIKLGNVHQCECEVVISE